MQIILLVDLPQQLSIHCRFDNKRIAFPRCRTWIRICKTKSILQLLYSSSGCFCFLFYIVFEISRQAFNFLNFLLQVASETSELYNHFIFYCLCFVALTDCLLVVGLQNLCHIANSALCEKPRRGIDIPDDIGKGVQRLGTHFVSFLNITEVRDQILEDLAPGWAVFRVISNDTL